MARDFAKDSRVFNLKDDLEQISNLYHPHQGEVQNFLRSQNGSGNLLGVLNEQVYELIADKLEYSVPK